MALRCFGNRCLKWPLLYHSSSRMLLRQGTKNGQRSSRSGGTGNGKLRAGNGERETENEERRMGNGVGGTEYGERRRRNGERGTENKERRTRKGEQGTENEWRRTRNGERENGGTEERENGRTGERENGRTVEREVVQSERLHSIYFSRIRNNNILDFPAQLLSLKLLDLGIRNEYSTNLSVFDLSIFFFCNT